MPESPTVIETDIPARLDRLPWTRFHTLVVVALGITWVLDGLEVTVAGSIAGALQESPVLHFTAAEVGLVGSAYLVGAVIGAVLFGYLTDRFGRKRLFMVTLGIYLTATAATALSWDFWSFAVFRASDRGRYRRRVHRDQLGDPGTDTGAVPRPHRPRDQRQLLARSGVGRRRRHRLSAAGLPAARLGLARGVRHRGGPRAVHPGLAAIYSGKPALADPARPRRRGGKRDQGYRAAGRACRGDRIAGAAGRADLAPPARTRQSRA